MTQTDPAPHPRILPLSSAQNLRDMGGYQTADGRRVRWRTLFRSGQMAGLSGEDSAALAELGIRAIVDLRDNQERAAHPTRWHEATAATLWARDHDHGTGDLSAIVADPAASADDMRNVMLGIYRALPEAQAEGCRTILSHMAAGEGPVLFNCTAGKDRTGFAAALVLRLLGVHAAEIEADFLASNHAIDGLTRHLAASPLFGRMVRDTPAVARPLLHVEPAYLDTAFSVIAAEHGSVEGYARDRLGLAASELDAIRATMLQR